MTVDDRDRRSALAVEAYRILAAVEQGEISLTMTTPHAADDGWGTSHPEYSTGDGWRFRVFDDCGDWDYVDAFAPPGGDWIEHLEMADDSAPAIPLLARYGRPRGAVSLSHWHWVRGGRSPSGYAAPREGKL